MNEFPIVKTDPETTYLVETFISLEGEGPYTGRPTVYSRLGGCNFRCKGFNNPDKKDVVLDFEPSAYHSLESLPLIKRGCDSNYAVDKHLFKHLWEKVTAEECFTKVIELLPDNKWKGKTGLEYIYSITGGEPTLYQDFLIELFDEIIKSGCRVVLIETNGSIEFKKEFKDALWKLYYHVDKIIWSNSPKLTNSGENFPNTIKPEVILSQQIIPKTEQYFKFVTDGNIKDIEEIVQTMELYRKAKIDVDADQIYLMPMACTKQQLEVIGPEVATICIKYGFTYCNRLQNTLWGNGVGT